MQVVQSIFQKGDTMQPMRKQDWKLGDVFLVETKDGLKVIGQIVGQEKEVLNSASCAFFNIRVKDANDVANLKELPNSRVFSIQFVTRDLLDDGVWRIVKQLPISVDNSQLPFETLRSAGFVGAKVIGSGIINEFLNAYYGLVPWDDWKDPAYLDRLLLSVDKKPTKLILK